MHPADGGRVLDARVADAHGHTALSGKLSPQKHWLLDGHRTKNGHALVPGTGYLELARAALLSVAPTRLRRPSRGMVGAGLVALGALIILLRRDGEE